MEPVNKGAGVLILFHDQQIHTSSNYMITVTDSEFNNNVALNRYYHSGCHCICTLPFYETGSHSSATMPIVNGAGITILYTQTDVPATTHLLRNNFKNCHGYFAGALLVLRINSPVDSQININSSVFMHNSLKAPCHGAAIAGDFYFTKYTSNINATYHPFIVTNTTFIDNRSVSAWSGGAVVLTVHVNNSDAVHTSINFIFRQVNFSLNSAETRGACVYATISPHKRALHNSVNLVMESIVAYNIPVPLSNKVHITKSVFHFSQFESVTINGSELSPGNFYNNFGSVFEIVQSKVTLKGHLIFNNNTGYRGAGITLLGNCELHLRPGLRANFTNNTVQSLGGAIYAMGHSDFFLKSRCTFQIDYANYDNISITFINNTAKLAGNAVYSTILYKCYMDNIKEDVGTVYEQIFKEISPLDLSTYAKEITLCSHNQQQFYECYPGESFHIPIRTIDVYNHSTYAVITKSVRDSLNWWFSGPKDTSNYLRAEDYCTNISIALYTNDKSTLGKKEFLLFSLLRKDKTLEVSVQLKPCPTGFELDMKEGNCACSRFLKTAMEYYNKQDLLCHIENSSFSRLQQFIWAGITQDNKFGICYFCHYCNFDSYLDTFIVNSSKSVKKSFVISSKNSSSQKPLCYGNREGDICGVCLPGHSVVFGSHECMKCDSKWWLFTSILYVVIGPMLICLLYILRLTLVSGTLNGIIFYVQIFNAVMENFINFSCSDCGKEELHVRITNMFIATLNLNLGFPLCFYDKMDAIWKAGLSLLFPLYLLAIVSFLIILSRYSSRVSNLLCGSSIQVLVTIIHLSFSRLLQTYIDVFASSKIYVDNGGGEMEIIRVWYSDGTILYYSSRHAKLMIIASVVVGVILIPYLVVMIFGNRLLKVDKFREYIRPFYEAIHAPYKDDMWYWYALYQLFIALVYISIAVFAGDPSFFLAITLLMIIFQIVTICHAYFMPFKNFIQNLLKLIILLSLSSMFLIAWYLFQYTTPKDMILFIAMSVYPLIIFFLFIITYHILLRLGHWEKVVMAIKSLKRTLTGYKTNAIWSAVSTAHDTNLDGSFFDDDYSQVREPLLEH